jgi:uncharacterized membrane protein YtjA (UPF0391 family)
MTKYYSVYILIYNIIINNPCLKVGDIMDLIWLAIVFLVLALIAYVLGARGVAGFSMEIAKWLVIIFVILAVITFLFGGRILLPAMLI